MLLAGNAARLAESGLLFPRATRPRHLFKTEIAGHHNLPWYDLGDDRFDPRDGGVDELLVEIRRESLPVVLLSSEDFGLTAERPAGLGTLRDALEGAGYRTHAIVYLRPQRGYAHSLYTELGRQGLAIGFESFFRDVVRGGAFRIGKYLMDFDYGRFTRALAGIFGERTIVRPYHPGARDDALARDYLGLVSCGLAIRYGDLVPVARENVALTYADIVRLQFSNFARESARFTHPGRLEFDTFGCERPKELDDIFAPLGPADDAALETRFGAANREVASRFGFDWGSDPAARDQLAARAFLEHATSTWARERAQTRAFPPCGP